MSTVRTEEFYISAAYRVPLAAVTPDALQAMDATIAEQIAQHVATWARRWHTTARAVQGQRTTRNEIGGVITVQVQYWLVAPANPDPRIDTALREGITDPGDWIEIT